MANTVRIKYLYRERSNMERFIQKTAFTDVLVNWDALNCEITINWEWGQESQVKELLKLIDEIFKEPEITIDNDENQVVFSPNKENGENIIKTKVEATTETMTKPEVVEEVKAKAEVSEATVEIKEEPKAEPEVIVDNKAKVDETEGKAESKASFKIHTETELEPNAINQKGENNTSNELNIRKEPSVNNPESVEDSPPETMDKNDKPNSKEIEKALKELLGDKLSEYDFSSDSQNVANKFCLDFDIKGEPMLYALALVSEVPNEDLLMYGLARLRQKNSAFVKFELNGCFKKWIKTSYPDFLKEYPDVNVMHFLNIFRDENNKF